jgi:hypothetical protein
VRQSWARLVDIVVAIEAIEGHMTRGDLRDGLTDLDQAHAHRVEHEAVTPCPLRAHPTPQGSWWDRSHEYAIKSPSPTAVQHLRSHCIRRGYGARYSVVTLSGFSAQPAAPPCAEAVHGPHPFGIEQKLFQCRSSRYS